jgi:GNAT superfamily N-acetyltransferase
MDLPIPRVETELKPEDVRFIEDRLYDYNVEQTGLADGRWLTIFVRDDNGDIAAGLHGWTWGGGCRVQTLWVRSDLRRHGYGTRLLAAAEAEARVRGCDRLLLDTFSFQAPLFYQKHGYEIVGVDDDVLSDHKLYRLKKRLSGDCPSP